MSMGIHYLPWDLAICTTSFTTPSMTKGERPPQRTVPNKIQSQRAKLMLLVAHPYHAVPSQTLDPWFPVSREQQTGISVMAHCRGHTNLDLFQDKTTAAARQGSDFTNPQSLMSQLLFTASPRLHRELSAATAPLPIPGMLSRLLPFPFTAQGDSAQLPGGKSSLLLTHMNSVCPQ